MPDLVGTYMMEWGGRVHLVQRLSFPLPLALIPNKIVPSSILISTLSSVFLPRTVYSKSPGLSSIVGLPEKPLY